VPFNHPGWYLATSGRREAVSKVECDEVCVNYSSPG
jgi:hypothetical protein